MAGRLIQKVERTVSQVSLTLTCLALVLFLVFTGCAKSSVSPKFVADSFLRAFVKKDAHGTFKYLSEKSKEEMGITGVTWMGVLMGLPIDTTESYTILREEISGDSARVDIETSRGENASVRLVKEKGKWLVDYTFGEMFGLGLESH